MLCAKCNGWYDEPSSRFWPKCSKEVEEVDHLPPPSQATMAASDSESDQTGERKQSNKFSEEKSPWWFQLVPSVGAILVFFARGTNSSTALLAGFMLGFASMAVGGAGYLLVMRVLGEKGHVIRMPQLVAVATVVSVLVAAMAPS